MAKATTPLLKGLAKDGHPKPLIETISEDLLATFKTAPLLDAYDVYQHLMDYWAETMQDDCYLIADAGWKAGAQPREIRQVKNKENKLVWPEKHDFKKGKRRFKSDLIPAALLIARYFTAERDAIAALEAELAGIEQQLDEKREEQSGEEGLLAEVIEGEGEKQKITAKALKARLKEIGRDPDYAEERQALEDYAALLDQQADTKPGSRPRRKTWKPSSTPNTPRSPRMKSDPRGGRQMAGHHRRRRAGRTGPRLANPHRPHPPARRTLRHPAAAAHR
jgi:type I restriction enzyme M protein